MKDVFDRVREGAARVVAEATLVRIEPARVEALADSLAAAAKPAPTWDPRYHHVGSPGSTVAFVVTWNAVNFGSGWFPKLRKRGSLSGALTVLTGLKQRFDSEGPWSAAALAEMEPEELAPIVGQDLGEPEATEIVGLWAEALRQLGAHLLAHFAGSFEALVAAAGGSAARLVELLARMPFYRDVAIWRGAEVPFYKRAQITASDLALAFEGKGPGAFCDLDRMTLFADNLVPHVLRHHGVLAYAESLAERIEREELLPAGGEEEVQIRACAVHAVELLAGALARRARPTPPRILDSLLWTEGQSPHIKARPRHRTRTVYY
ncbi:MAG TPA: queuosine salvage family protein [Myxococcota bacterium]|nr:queuosine salvage family protein [Myxococcota bacterium]